MKFVPILEDKPLSFAHDNPDYFRNKAREDKWNGVVYFAPSTWIFDKKGTGGPYYKYGYTADKKKGMYGNCTWWAITSHHYRSGQIESSIIGPAGGAFDRYKGRKEGSLSKAIYIGDKIQPGDMLVWADDLKNSGDGHINVVEKIDGDTVWISESGYSKKPCYKDKTCIVYKLNKNVLTTTKKITLRPVQPYSEYLYGVIHTGDVYDKEVEKDYKTLYEEAKAKLDKIKEIVND